MKRLLKSNTCLVVLHSLYLVRRFLDDLFVPNFLDFENFMYLYPDSFRSGIYPETSCECNCTSEGFSCNFLDLTMSQSPQSLSFGSFDKPSQLGLIRMIRMHHVHSNMSTTAKLGVISGQFYRFSRLCSCNK
jgi:hypothetical protein